MRLLLIALSFFTRIPINLKSEVSENDFFKSMLLLPLVGLFIGLLLYLIALIINVLNYIYLKSFLLILFYIYLTGGLHLDGVADTVDALFSARDRERMFEIMQDSRLGTFGAVALSLLILAYFVSFTYIFENGNLLILIVFPIIGRFSALLLGGISKASPDGGGLAKGFCAVDKKWISALYLIIILPLFWYFLGKVITLSFIITIIVTLLEALFFNYKLGGISGDQFGLTIEIEQIVFFFSFIILNSL